MAVLLEPSDLENLHGRIAIDVETVGGHAPHLGTLVGTGVWCEDAGVIGYVPGDRWVEIRRAITKTWKKGSWLIAHNLKYEARWLRLTPEDLRRFRLFDTAVAEHLLNENVTKDLGSIEARRLKTKTKASLLAEAKRLGCHISRVDEWPMGLLAEYCVNDTRITYRSAEVQAPLVKEERVDRLLRELMDYLVVLHGSESRGMLIDDDALFALRKNLKSAIGEGEERWKNVLKAHGVSREVNYRSAVQLSKLLYEELGLEKPVVPPELAHSSRAKKFTKTSTDKQILETFDHPVPRAVLQIKALRTIDGYLDSYEKLGQETEEGLVLHPDFNMTGTITGRLSSSNPNVQQISARGVATGRGNEIIDVRSIFRARRGFVLVAIDYQQMEAVVFGLLSRDPNMMKLIRRGGDIHAAAAEMIFGSYDKQKRRITKNLNFGLLYGLGRPGLASTLGMPQSESDELMERYLRAFPRARPYMSEVAAKLHRRGFIRYWSGRKRRIKEFRHHYKGVNSEIQGGCADAVARAAIRVDNVLRPVGGHILAVIHDEFVLELPEERVQGTDSPLLLAIQEAMSVPDAFGWPLATEAKVGTFWGIK